jgi:cystine transport system substrate-binding protein
MKPSYKILLASIIQLSLIHFAYANATLEHIQSRGVFRIATEGAFA